MMTGSCGTAPGPVLGGSGGTEPATLVEIASRLNELSGNLPLYQELAFIEKD